MTGTSTQDFENAVPVGTVEEARFDTEIDLAGGLNLSGKNKSQITELAHYTARMMVENGQEAIRPYCQGEKVKHFIAELQKALKDSGGFRDEVFGYGKGGATKEGVNLTLAGRNEYDYSGDDMWNDLKAAAERAAEALKAHQEMLRKLPAEGLIIVNEITGVQYRAMRPAVISGETVKATILNK